MQVSQLAIQYIKSLNSGTVIRIKVVGGGCSGMSYTLDFDSNPPAETDKIYENEGITLHIDSKSNLVLSGATLDYSGGLSGQGLFIDSPNFNKVCGCGQSFSL